MNPVGEISLADIIAVDTSRVYGEANVNYAVSSDQDPNAYNRIFIQCQQNYANQRLYARGHVFLNEVYEYLGFEQTAAGAILGWLHESDDPAFVVSGYIDFGMNLEINQKFQNGESKEVTLIFNVDGVMFHKI